MDTLSEDIRRRVPVDSSPEHGNNASQRSNEAGPVVSPCSRGWPVLSLFSGAGGLDLGFRNAGFQPIIAIDFDPVAIETYRSNNPGVTVVEMDLSSTPPTAIADFWKTNAGGVNPVGIIGGPPCQGYSSANVHQTDDDPRRQLLFNYVDIVAKFKERYEIDFFVLENVPGLLNQKHNILFTEFKEQCDNAGFEVADEKLDAGTFGIAQRRERLVVAGINRERYPSAKLHLPTGDQTTLNVADVLRGLPEPTYCARGIELGSIPYHRNHVAMVPRSKKFTDGSLKQGNSRGLSFKVLEWDAPSYTVAYGHNEIHVHPECHRRLSIYEAMLLQGFPQHGYHLHGNFTEQVQLISNAVPPPLGEGIANAIANSLGYKQPSPQSPGCEAPA